MHRNTVVRYGVRNREDRYISLGNGNQIGKCGWVEGQLEWELRVWWMGGGKQSKELCRETAKIKDHLRRSLEA